MTDDELRAIVREAIARHMAGGAVTRRHAAACPAAMDPGAALVPEWGTARIPQAAPPSSQARTPAAGASAVIANAPGGVAIAAGPGASVQVHISHATFALLPARDGGRDGSCGHEPGGTCNQCGFCQSFGY